MGKSTATEESVRTAFRRFIGADTDEHDKSKGVKILWNESKGVFQASVDIGTHHMSKEFVVKGDAQHWADLVHSLQTAGKLKAHCSLLQKAEANRKATQAAYDQIMSGKGVFSPEDNPHFQNDPKLGKDVWATMFTRYQEPKESLPTSSVRVHKGSLEEITVMGSKKPIYAELLGWKHKLLGWRVTHILHHSGEEGVPEAVAQQVSDLGLVHLGFIRCMGGDSADPGLSQEDKTKLKTLSFTVPEAIAVIVGYKIVTGVVRAWTPSEAKVEGSGFTEVELGTIVRRVEGERFLVTSAIPQPSWKETLDSKIQNHFQETLRKSLNKEQPLDVESFKLVRILGDGHCFFHSFLFWSLRDEYYPIGRNPGGGAKSPERLLEEIRRAKKLWKEVESLANTSREPLPSSFLDSITKSPVVDIEHVGIVANLMNVHFRITIDPKAGKV